MSHRHVNGAKPCLTVGPTVCLTRTTEGYLVHFDPPGPGGFRQVGAVRIGEGGWTQEGSFAAGDLTIKPSIRIATTVDGAERELLHGFITDGKWVPA